MKVFAQKLPAYCNSITEASLTDLNAGFETAPSVGLFRLIRGKKCSTNNSLLRDIEELSKAFPYSMPVYPCAQHNIAGALTNIGLVPICRRVGSNRSS
jgi:hypothetical protein